MRMKLPLAEVNKGVFQCTDALVNLITNTTSTNAHPQLHYLTISNLRTSIFFSGVDVSIQFTHHFSNIRIEVEEEEAKFMYDGGMRKKKKKIRYASERRR